MARGGVGRPGRAAQVRKALPGPTLEDKQTVSHAFLASGAPVGEMNGVRKHLSAIKGGSLAAAPWPARVVLLNVVRV